MKKIRFSYRIASPKDADLVKYLINKMYGIMYEVRPCEEIAKAIYEKSEVYVLAFSDNLCIGFSGVSLKEENGKRIGIIDYIYVTEENRDISVSFQLIMKAIKALIEIDINKALMQVQTFNKQRFFHYALSDKNIISSEKVERKGKIYEDQILLINDLKKISKMTMKDLIKKAAYYSKLEK